MAMSDAAPPSPPARQSSNLARAVAIGVWPLLLLARVLWLGWDDPQNWLFAGSVEGGKRAATIYSLVTSCRRLGIDPQAYLIDVISRVPAHKMSKIDELTPRAWQLEHSW